MPLFHSEGYYALVDIESIVYSLLTQLGKWLSYQFKEEEQDDMEETCNDKQVIFKPEIEMPTAALRGFVDVDPKQYCTIRVDEIVFLMNALHSMLSLHVMLVNAITVNQNIDLIELNGHHKEASAEVFFIHSMTSDCVVGTITQYAHKFAYLFHSISQTIYYNSPTYARQRQLSIEELNKKNCCQINVLPLITEFRPEVSVLFEHTGAGNKLIHTQHKWAWVEWSHFVMLVKSDMTTYMADDIRSLLHWLDT